MTTNETALTEQGQAVVLLRDGEGGIYTLPQALVESHRVPDAHRAEVEQLIIGDNDVAGHLGPLMAAAAGTVVYVGVVYGAAYGGALAGWISGGGSLRGMPWGEVRPSLF